MINSNNMQRFHIQKSGQAADTPDKKCVLTKKNKENVNE